MGELATVTPHFGPQVVGDDEQHIHTLRGVTPGQCRRQPGSDYGGIEGQLALLDNVQGNLLCLLNHVDFNDACLQPLGASRNTHGTNTTGAA